MLYHFESTDSFDDGQLAAQVKKDVRNKKVQR
jgi:hypothetical protein